MLGNRTLRGILYCTALLVAGCSSPSGPTDQPVTDTPSPGPAPTETQAAPPAPQPEALAASLTESPAAPAALVESAPVRSAPASPAVATAPPPPQLVAPDEAVQTSPAPAAPAPAPTPAVVDVGGAIAVAATRPGVSRVGSEKCDMCHEVQFASWAKTAHAARKPPLDCEGCHGAGSAYKTMAIMQDPAKARAAGLVIPDRSFCSQCHMKGVSDDLLKRTHAHDGQTG